jgi:hypothetical protein
VDAGASVAVAGLTPIEVSVTELTFTDAAAVMPLMVAWIFAVPGARAAIVPEGPTVATATLSDAQVTSRVMTCVLASLNAPVAASDNLVAGAMMLSAGVTEMETTCALVTSSVTEALTGPRVAVIVAIPGLRPLASPLLLTFATGALEVVHTA